MALNFERTKQQLREFPLEHLQTMGNVYTTISPAHLTSTEQALYYSLGCALLYIAELKSPCAEGDFECIEHKRATCPECYQHDHTSISS